jgi:Tfp pilus assembly PilM family ATPase
MTQVSDDHSLALDFGYGSLKVLAGGDGTEFSLDRDPQGAVTEACRERVVADLRRFLTGSAGSSRHQVCAVPARGVSLRRLALPRVAPDELRRLLALQIERELPLPADELVWGYQVHGAVRDEGGVSAEEASLVDVTVAAVRRDAIEAYAGMLRACGLHPVYTVGVLAAAWQCGPHAGNSILLDIGRTHTEILCFVRGRPHAVRSVPWGGDVVTEAFGRSLGVSLGEAEKLKRAWGGGTAGAGDPEGAAMEAAAREAVHVLGRLLAEVWASDLSINGTGRPERVVVVGRSARLPALARELEASLGGSATSTVAEAADSGPGRSAVTLGIVSLKNGELPLALQAPAKKKEKAPVREKRSASLRFWLVAVLLLAAASAGLRFAVPILRLPSLKKELVAARTLRDAMPNVDSELAFLQFVEGSQVAYLEGLAVLASASPKGMQFGAVTMDRRGELSVAGTAAPGQPNELRGALARSGFFTRVVILEEGPSKRQKKKVDFRLSARFTTQAGARGKLAGKEAPPGEAGKKEKAPGPPAGEKKTEARPGEQTGKTAAEMKKTEAPEAAERKSPEPRKDQEPARAPRDLKKAEMPEEPQAAAPPAEQKKKE